MNEPPFCSHNQGIGDGSLLGEPTSSVSLVP